MSFLDCNGALIPYSYEAWKDENKEGRERISKDAVAQSMYIRSFSSKNHVTLPLKVINNLKLRPTDNLHFYIVCLYFILNLVCVVMKMDFRPVYNLPSQVAYHVSWFHFKRPDLEILPGMSVSVK